MVKNDQESWGLAWVFQSCLALLTGTIFLAFLSLDYANKWIFALNTAIFGASALSYFVQARRWKPMNYRRQMAAAWGFAGRVPLAQPHPLPNVGALPLPFTITLRPGWTKFLLVLGVLVGLVLYSISSFFLAFGEHEAPLLNPFMVAYILLIVLVGSPFILLLLRPQRIEITPEGLTVRHAAGRLHGKPRIRWSEARLFAIRSSKRDTLATRYELASPSVVVQWQRLRRPRWWSLHRPAIPFAEYDAQMEALIALISGVTGLPLYDVR